VDCFAEAWVGNPVQEKLYRYSIDEIRLIKYGSNKRLNGKWKVWGRSAMMFYVTCAKGAFRLNI
jgi:hypothetical protein